MKRVRGRPRLKKGVGLTETIPTFRVTRDAYKWVMRQATARGQGINEFCRMQLLRGYENGRSGGKEAGDEPVGVGGSIDKLQYGLKEYGQEGEREPHHPEYDEKYQEDDADDLTDSGDD